MVTQVIQPKFCRSMPLITFLTGELEFVFFLVCFSQTSLLHLSGEVLERAMNESQIHSVHGNQEENAINRQKA